VRKAFDTQRKQSFPKDADYQKFLKNSGQTEADILKRVRLDTLSNKLRDKVVKGKDKVTPAQIQAYYNKNRAQFGSPEKRDLRIVLTKTRARADQALKALKSGQSWKVVAKKFSIDATSKSNGGKLPAQAKGTLGTQLDAAVFSAPKGKIQGPVKTQFGYYVFVVEKIAKATQQSLVQATPTIKQTLASQNQQKALDAFVKDFQSRWRGKTECSNGYKTSECKNGPKPTPTPTASAGTVPGGTGTGTGNGG
jgi:foldase protein PrsA